MFQPLSYEIDSCCCGSDCVTKRNSCQLKFSGSYYVNKRNSCQLKFSGSDYVNKRNSCQLKGSSFQTSLCEFVLVFSSLLSVPTADVRYMLVFLQCYPAVPATKNTLVLAAWINFIVGTPTIHNTLVLRHLILIQIISSIQYIRTTRLFPEKV